VGGGSKCGGVSRLGVRVGWFRWFGRLFDFGGDGELGTWVGVGAMCYRGRVMVCWRREGGGIGGGVGRVGGRREGVCVSWRVWLVPLVSSVD
jgi:hypothetical protein